MTHSILMTQPRVSHRLPTACPPPLYCLRDRARGQPVENATRPNPDAYAHPARIASLSHWNMLSTAMQPIAAVGQQACLRRRWFERRWRRRAFQPDCAHHSPFRKRNPTNPRGATEGHTRRTPTRAGRVSGDPGAVGRPARPRNRPGSVKPPGPAWTTRPSRGPAPSRPFNGIRLRPDRPRPRATRPAGGRRGAHRAPPPRTGRQSRITAGGGPGLRATARRSSRGRNRRCRIRQGRSRRPSRDGSRRPVPSARGRRRPARSAGAA